MLKQFLNLKLSQKLSPQQIQLMKLIQLPTSFFEQRLLEEMNENPALETGKEEGITERRVRNEDYDDYDDAESER
jgi:RNA polymerase sigma-54 factor